MTSKGAGKGVLGFSEEYVHAGEGLAESDSRVLGKERCEPQEIYSTQRKIDFPLWATKCQGELQIQAALVNLA